jgi:hypothetical protein
MKMADCCIDHGIGAAIVTALGAAVSLLGGMNLRSEWQRDRWSRSLSPAEHSYAKVTLETGSGVN